MIVLVLEIEIVVLLLFIGYFLFYLLVRVMMEEVRFLFFSGRVLTLLSI